MVQIRPSRRAFGVGLAAAGALMASARTASASPRPQVIAHRGASGYRPEHTASAYRLAIAQGADVIEPDLVLTKDGVLVARHENDIGDTTDVASRPEFASRRRVQEIDGERFEGWFTEDFTLAELKTLRARERLPQLRPGSARHDGEDQILTFAEVAAIARRESARTGRPIGICPEMKHPAHFRRLGLAFEPIMAAALKAERLDSPSAPVLVQCFEVGPLKTLATLSGAPRVQLVSAEGGPADLPGVRYQDMVTAEGLMAIAGYAQAVGPEWRLVLKVDDAGALAGPTPLVDDARAARLKVFPWTVRAENAFLPRALQRGEGAGAHGDPASLLKALYAAGVDGVFCDFPDLAVAARDGESLSPHRP
jgi:glycerophosphoryl diester phosphodiesterase